MIIGSSQSGAFSLVYGIWCPLIILEIVRQHFEKFLLSRGLEESMAENERMIMMKNIPPVQTAHVSNTHYKNNPKTGGNNSSGDNSNNSSIYSNSVTSNVSINNTPLSSPTYNSHAKTNTNVNPVVSSAAVETKRAQLRLADLNKAHDTKI